MLRGWKLPLQTRYLHRPFTMASYKPTIKKPLVWIDCEMTGLDVYNDNIIEICCLITDADLNIIDEKGFESTVYVPKEKLDQMGEWCVEHHTKLGLVDKILQNPDRTLQKVESELFDYIKYYINEPKKGLLAGNSIHMDKFFMMREFPKIIDYLHYRLLDVSSISEICRRHNNDLLSKCPRKRDSHTAKNDIQDSIAQLKWFQQNYLKNSKETENVTNQSKTVYQL